jgi:hypothetical protein
MLSLIEVKCPHCGAHGQIMLPPVGTIIVGPCPECQELVVVFCGNVLPLHKETMLNGPVQEKREHMLSVLTQFLRERVAQMITDESPAEEGEATGETGGGVETKEPEKTKSHLKRSAVPGTPITQTEVDAFSNVELKLLDNGDYFKSIFT